MNLRTNTFFACCALLLVTCRGTTAQPRLSLQSQSQATGLGGSFVSENVEVNGTSLHYVRGGSGPAVILLHGFPEDWYEFHKIMPPLAQQFTVVAVDLRGVGESTPAPSGYDAANLAKDIYELTQRLNLEHPYIFGHDVGGMVAYAYARLYPQTVRGVMILDVPLPGLPPWEKILDDPLVWHIRFHQADNLADRLVAGRQKIYFRYFLRPETFSDADVEHYAHSYRDPDHLRVAFEFYRAFPANEQFNASHRTAIDTLLVFGSGEHDAFAKYVPAFVDSMRAYGCNNVKIEMIPDAVHYVAEEKPEIVTKLIERYAVVPSVSR